MTDALTMARRRSPRKGKKFELVVRDHLRLVAREEPWISGLTVRRSSQAERAWNADLIIEGVDAVPGWLLGLWLECEHANDPDPRAKFAQATRDVARYCTRTGRPRWPVIVWRRTGGRVLNATTSVDTLLQLLSLAGKLAPSQISPSGACGTLATMAFPELMQMLLAPT